MEAKSVLSPSSSSDILLNITTIINFKRQPCNDSVIYYSSMHIDQSLTGICMLTFLSLAYVNYRVIKIVGTKDI